MQASIVRAISSKSNNPHQLIYYVPEMVFQERKKLTLVKVQAYLRAGKAKKSAMLDDFCQSTGYCRRYMSRVLHLASLEAPLGWNESPRGRHEIRLGQLNYNDIVKQYPGWRAFYRRAGITARDWCAVHGIGYGGIAAADAPRPRRKASDPGDLFSA